MSYCRWSSDGGQCDVHCYADVSGGFTTHVAASRRKHPVTELDFRHGEEIFFKAELRDKDTNPLLPIGLPHDGKTFNDSTLRKFLDRLIYLKGLGYIVPDWVIEDVEMEIRENDSTAVAI